MNHIVFLPLALLLIAGVFATTACTGQANTQKENAP
jgi:hypothetical protein